MRRRRWEALFALLFGTALVFWINAAHTTPVPSVAPSSITPSFSTPTAGVSASVAIPPSGCIPTDQNQYVYHPTRLIVLSPCVRVTGTVAVVRTEPDGDLHILLALDPAFASFLTPANANEHGDLVIEPVCVKPVTQADAIALCKTDPDPLAGPFPKVGQHVWMEGRYVTDSDHGGWAELHPLFVWGVQ